MSTWSQNPWCVVEVLDTLFDSTVIFEIAQPRKQNHPIGFVLLKGDEPCPDSPSLAAARVIGGRPWHQNRFEFKNVSAGKYTIVAQTFNAGCLGKFTIRVLSATASLSKGDSYGGFWAENKFYTV